MSYTNHIGVIYIGAATQEQKQESIKYYIFGHLHKLGLSQNWHDLCHLI